MQRKLDACHTLVSVKKLLVAESMTITHNDSKLVNGFILEENEYGKSKGIFH